jgi:adenylate cyclase
MSPDPNDEFFADGLTEEIITSLSMVRGLKVIARTSAMNYKKKEKSVSEIGRELGVATVVEGSVRKAGNRIRVTVQVIDVKTEEHLWASNYDRSLDDIFAVQSDIASKVAESVPSSLVGPTT